MSFVDLATLTLHRRHEMESRINIFMEKVGHLENNVNKLKMQARGLVNQLNCEPAELKDKFLDGMKKLDEYIYLATEFNLSFAKLAETSGLEFTPVHDVSNHMATPAHPAHLLDVLSEPVPSTSMTKTPPAPPVTNTTKPKKLRPPKDDVLINFSSASCSQESMPESRQRHEDVQCGPLVAKMSDMNISGPPDEMLNIPAQVVLQTDIIYHGVITHVDGPALWIITDNVDEVRKLMHDMRDHYLCTPPVVMSRAQLQSLTYCAYYDQESDCPYRCLFLRELDDSSETTELFLIDTGEIRESPVNVIQPLHPNFFQVPPFARCCHLAGVDILGHQNKETTTRLENFLKNYIGEPCDIEVDDNTSESLGVFIQLQSKQYLNQIMIDQGLAAPVPHSLPGPAPVVTKPEDTKFTPEVTSSRTDSDIDILACPEHEDVLEAVTGYHNNDERDICKHYKGGPDKSCFKGPRCKKRHVTMHPDGWTLDRVSVAAATRLRGATLPAPGAGRRARVTCVPHLDHVYLQFVAHLPPEPKRRFGEVVPPTSLQALVRDMNSAAGRVAHKPLKLAPAPGELVAAIFPPDEQWYRAVVLSLANYDQSVQVRYVDYGNEMWIKENLLRTLDPSYTLLPIQAVRCRLAGVAAKGDDPELWGRAKTALSDLVLEKTLNVLIVARHYDELEIELYDENDEPISDKLVAMGLVLFQDYTIQDDTNVRHKMIVP